MEFLDADMNPRFVNPCRKNLHVLGILTRDSRYLKSPDLFYPARSLRRQCQAMRQGPGFIILLFSADSFCCGVSIQGLRGRDFRAPFQGLLSVLRTTKLSESFEVSEGLWNKFVGGRAAAGKSHEASFSISSFRRRLLLDFMG